MTGKEGVCWRAMEKERGRERNMEGEKERETGRERGIESNRRGERERERCRKCPELFIFKRNDGCLGTF
jgi:hypothetical protein